MLTKIFKVIKIIDEYSILIDYGNEQGAKKGEKIRIFLKGEEIKNCNGIFLDNIDIIKKELTIEKVYEKFSLCKKSYYKEINPFAPISFIKREKILEKLNVNNEEITKIEFSSEEPIKIGDLVKIVNKSLH